MHSVTISTAGVMYSVYHSRECMCMCMNRIQSLCVQDLKMQGVGGGGAHNFPPYPPLHRSTPLYLHAHICT